MKRKCVRTATTEREMSVSEGRVRAKVAYTRLLLLATSRQYWIHEKHNLEQFFKDIFSTGQDLYWSSKHLSSVYVYLNVCLELAPKRFIALDFNQTLSDQWS